MEAQQTQHAREVDPVFVPSSIRRAARALFNLAQLGELEHFELHAATLDTLVKDMTRGLEPAQVAPHTQWRNFEQDGIQRIAAFNKQLSSSLSTPMDCAQARLDLLFLNEALETGGNGTWRYYDALSDRTLTRTEALATATLRLLQNGFFSAYPEAPFRVDAIRLRQITESQLATSLQISNENQILGGVEAKLARLSTLANYLENTPEFKDRSGSRPGNILNFFRPRADMALEPLFTFLAQSLTSIWPGNTHNGRAIGDAWHHSALKSDSVLQGIVPIHRITQWLHYAIAPALSESGLHSFPTTDLSGLPGYRNTGLLIDSGIIQPRSQDLLSREHLLGDEPIVELRCLTIGVMGRALESIHQQLSLDHDTFPMAKLNGLFWHAGRAKASGLRPGGSPPFSVRDQGVPF